VARWASHVKEAIEEEQPDADVLVVCRRGNDSQVAASALIQAGLQNVCDLEGGLHSWALEIDSDMPIV
jgi:sulfur-carrier protein adenylyltransferase/sulfurtransferase